MRISINLNKKEKALANRYVLSLGMSLEETFKSAIFETMEEEYDIAIAELRVIPKHIVIAKC